LSEVLKLRATKNGMKISRAVNVLPRVSASAPKPSMAKHQTMNPGSQGMSERTGAFVGADDVDAALQAEYERGVADGRRRAEEAMNGHARNEIQAEHQRVEKFFAHAAEQWSGLHAVSEEATVKFAFGIAERIIRKEISVDRNIVVAQIKEGIRRVLGVETVKIRVHPEDLPLVREQKAGIQASGDALREIVVEGDESLEPGDCIIESDMGNIDARITTQLKQIENVLFESKVIS
jgi:flagellar assembly protein FliH